MTRPLHPAPGFALPINADDVCRHALAAYYRARLVCQEHPDDQNPEAFVGILLDLFRARVLDTAGSNGVQLPALLQLPRVPPVGTVAAYPADLTDDGKQAEFFEDFEQADPGAGRSPAVKGHGCPALASPAVGPAPAPCPSTTASAAGSEADITLHADPLFCAPRLQRLPAGESLEILNDGGENIRE